MTTLITGGLGFIGLHTARALLDAGQDVVLTQHSVRREPDFLADEWGKRAHIEQLDVADADAWAAIGRKHKIDGIVHLAAPSYGPQGPMHGLDAEMHTNMLGLTNVLEAARAWGVKRLSLASSIVVYAGIAEGPFREDMPLRPIGTNTTETFKKMFEVVGSYYGQQAKLDIVMLRIANIYGPVHHSVFHQVTRLVIAAMKGETRDPDRDVHDDDPADYCYVKDCADAITRLQLADSLPNRVYNIGAGRQTTNREVVDAIKRAVPESQLELEPGRGQGRGVGWRDNVYMDLSRIKADVGYEPRWPLDRAIPDYVEWLKTHES
ncbi:MAG TPA: NAD(P)-dependent oxidoreductase [Dehalococcoidia bacterium]|nr:NAD(P)-dependent oxidoreductase [Dehalococcoidia bacterium]